MGAYRYSNPNFVTWTHLGRPRLQRSYIFYEAFFPGILRFAVDFPASDSIGSLPPPPQPSSEPERLGMEDYFYTCATLDDIKSFRPSYSHQGGIRVITGLLFLDADGHESCVGQVRYDSLGDKQEVDKSEKLWLAFIILEEQPCVIRVETSNALEGVGDFYWLDVPWKGKLEWWFSHRQCRVYHGDRSSPRTRIWFW